jgi:hypothetical protein
MQGAITAYAAFVGLLLLIVVIITTAVEIGRAHV